MAAAARPARPLRVHVRAQGDGAGAAGARQAPPGRGKGNAKQPAPAAAPRRRESEVGIFWDLDNKQPEADAPPRALAAALRALGERYGVVHRFDAFANRHAFTYNPPGLAAASRREVAAAAHAAGRVCELCSARFKSLEALQKHFVQLHVREAEKQKRGWASRKKKITAEAIAKAKRVASAQRALFVPKTGNRVNWSLREEGVRVVKVPDKPQAADAALISALDAFVATRLPKTTELEPAENAQPPPTVLVVSDDSDFDAPLGRVAQRGARCVVVTKSTRAFAPGMEHVPWEEVLHLADLATGLFEEDEDEYEDEDAEDLERLMDPHKLSISMWLVDS